MAKIGTAHLEIKPVLNEEALDVIAARIEAAVRAGVEAGMASAKGATFNTFLFDPSVKPEDYERHARRRRDGGGGVDS